MLQVDSRWRAIRPRKRPQKAVARMEVFPPVVTLERALKHRLLVTAHFADGRTEDFPGRRSTTSNDKEIAKVDPSGLVSPGRYGETAILIRAAGQCRHCDSRRYRRTGCEISGRIRRNNYIDEFVTDKLRKFRIVPSELSSDSEFLRRVCLDLAGTLPPPERLVNFSRARTQKNARNSLTL